MTNFSSKFQWIEKKSSFCLIYSMIFWAFYFVNYEANPDTTPAPVLSIFNSQVIERELLTRRASVGGGRVFG